PREFAGFFYTEPGVSTYHLCIHIASQNASAWTLNFDNVRVGPDKLVPTPFIGEWEEYGPTEITAVTTAPTKNNSVARDVVLGKRVGGDFHCRMNYYQSANGSGGAAGSGIYLFKLPNGLKADLNKVKAIAPNANSVFTDGGEPVGIFTG